MLPLLAILLFTPVQNITCIYNISSIGALLGCDNTGTQGYFGIIVVLVLWVIGIFGLVAMGNDLEIAGLAVSFICTWITLILMALAIVNPLFIIVFIACDILFFILIQTKGSTQPYR